LSGERPKTEATNVEQVPVDHLLEGDTFTVQGHKFTVDNLDLDESGRLQSLTVKDGPKFGVQRIEPNETEVIHVDKGTYQSAEKPPTIGELPPKETFEQKLDKLKIDTKGTVQAFGLLPETWNTIIDLVKLGVKSGRKFVEAIDWAVARIK